MTDSQSRVHLVFKTHLDMGFTDYAAKVVEAYFNTFIPQAVALAQRSRAAGKYPFRWTVGSWLIYEYLEQASAADRRAMESAVEAGDLVWHALPFTLHSELVDASLFEFGLSYAKRLDQRFGKTTIAAKMTDVPGHTRSIVPLLAQAGVQFLHIGTNAAASVPDVPPVFRWRDEATATEILMVYDRDYGGVTRVPGLSEVLAVVLTGDNEGPPNDAYVEATYQSLARQLPDAKIIPSTLDDYAHHLLTVRDTLPVITSEIGDTWIQGAGTDPTKLRQYRELSRLRQEWLYGSFAEENRPHIERFSHFLLMVPEHTWGMDEKTHLADYSNYSRDELAVLRQTEAAKRFEASWTEQRQYLDQAVASLTSPKLKAETQKRLEAIVPHAPDLTTMESIPLDTEKLLLSDPCFDVAFDPQTGAIRRLVSRHTGREWADDHHLLALPRYQLFNAADYDRFWGQYIRNADDPTIYDWALKDNTKPGLPDYPAQQWQPTITGCYRTQDDGLLFTLTFPDDATAYGAPALMTLRYKKIVSLFGGVEMTCSWFNKPACRLPEALWLSFQMKTEASGQWTFQKIGHHVDPTDVVSHGGRTLHAIDQQIEYQSATNRESRWTLTSPDAALVAPGQPSLLDFHNRLPDMTGGIHFNLYNNVWGTNFPMWFEEDAVFRFQLRFT